MIFKLKNINNIEKLWKQFTTRSKKNLSSYGAQKNLHKIFLQTFCSYGTIFPEVKLLKILNKPCQLCDKLGKLLCYKTLRKTLLYYVKQIP